MEKLNNNDVHISGAKVVVIRGVSASFLDSLPDDSSVCHWDESSVISIGCAADNDNGILEAVENLDLNLDDVDYILFSR